MLFFTLLLKSYSFFVCLFCFNQSLPLKYYQAVTLRKYKSHSIWSKFFSSYKEWKEAEYKFQVKIRSAYNILN